MRKAAFQVMQPLPKGWIELDRTSAEIDGKPYAAINDPCTERSERHDISWPDGKSGGLRIVSISSSSKKAGKTALSAYLTRELGADYGLKVCADHHIPPIMEDPEIISKPGTDTGALVAAGARKVVWASSGTADGLALVITKALDLFPPHGVMIMESNSALQYITPDFAVFMMSVPFHEFKPSALMALAKADLVLLDLRCNLKGWGCDEIVSELAKRATDARLLSYKDEDGMREALQTTADMARDILELPLMAGLLIGDSPT